MDIFTKLTEMQQQIFDADWSAFCEHYFALCEQYNSETGRAIQDVNLSSYATSLGTAFAKSLAHAAKTEAAAIYFEYNLDNRWDSSFYICPEYHPLESKDDDWACTFSHSEFAGTQKQFAAAYDKTDKFCNTDEATAITLYLIARTTKTLFDVVVDADSSVAICVGFHDQDPIHRLVNAT